MTLLMKGSPWLTYPTARERCRASTLTPGISTGPEVHVDVYNKVISAYESQECELCLSAHMWPLSAYLDTTTVYVSCHVAKAKYLKI